jgi:HSP20 family protein
MKLSKRRRQEHPASPDQGESSSHPEWTRLRREIDRLFDEPLGFFTPTTFFEGWSPTLDIYEDKDKITVQAELPGAKKEDIEVSLHGDTLTIAGERKQEQEEKDCEVCRSERYFGRFQRSITLPQPVDASKIEAQYKEGVLTITCPKSEEAKRKHIEVKTS